MLAGLRRCRPVGSFQSAPWWARLRGAGLAIDTHFHLRSPVAARLTQPIALLLLLLLTGGGCQAELLQADAGGGTSGDGAASDANGSDANGSDGNGTDAAENGTDAADVPEDADATVEDGTDVVGDGTDSDTVDSDTADSAVDPCTTKDCDDKNPCTTDGCKEGACTALPVAATPCDDGNACTKADACDGGVCKGAPSAACNDGDACTDDSCDPGVGCKSKPKAKGLACDDGDACTLEETCDAGGKCLGTPKLCNDNNLCTSDACKLGVCTTTPVDGIPCEDGNACTTEDRCKGGACDPGPAPKCDDGKVCTGDGCDKASGCKQTPLPATTPCDDVNGCTTNDACDGLGACKGIGKSCDDDNACATDSCDANICSYKSLADGTACNDGDACTTTDVCAAGKCSAGPAKSCDDKNACTADACVTGVCKNVVKPTGACDDGDGCTESDSCKDGVCLPGSAKVCNDGNVCTTDACAGGSCTTVGLSGPGCDDLDNCTLGDVCSAGKCTAGTAKNCDDSNLCTDDSCSKGSCVATANTKACDDGSVCTVTDTCAAKACTGKKLAKLSLASVQSCNVLNVTNYPRMAFSRHSNGTIAVVGHTKCGTGSLGLGTTVTLLTSYGQVIGQPTSLFLPESNNDRPAVVATAAGWTIVTRIGGTAPALMAAFILADGKADGTLALPSTDPATVSVFGMATTSTGGTLVGTMDKASAGVVSKVPQVFELAGKTGKTLQSTTVVASGGAAAKYLLGVTGGFVYIKNDNIVVLQAIGSKASTWEVAGVPSGYSFISALGATGKADVIAVAGYLPGPGPSVGKAFLTRLNTGGGVLTSETMFAGGGDVVMAPYDVVPVSDGLLVAGVGGAGPSVLRYDADGKLVNTWFPSDLTVTHLLPVTGTDLVVAASVEGGVNLGFLTLKPNATVCE